MDIKVHTRDTALSPRLDDYIKTKLERLERYLSNITEANMELRKEGRSNQPVVQLTIRNERGTIFRAEEKKQDDFFAAVDIVVERMQRQLSKYKTKRSRKGKERWVEVQPGVDGMPMEDFIEEAEESFSVVRRKEMTLTPMLEEEAIEQFELLGHDFFVYMDGDSGSVNVLYRRRDGNYGMLITNS